MTHDTSPDDAVERANRTPEDASTADIEAALRGRRLFDAQLGQKIDGCRRCDEKNTKRRYAGVDLVDVTFDEGDAVTIHASHRESSHTGPHWFIASAEHRHHEQRPFADVVSSDTDLVRAHARIHATGEDEHILDVDIVERSRLGDGPEQSLIEARVQEYVDDDAPGPVTVIDRECDDPPAHWPDADRQWLQQLADEHTLEMPTYSFTRGDSSDENPRGDSR